MVNKSAIREVISPASSILVHLACFGYGIYRGVNPETNNNFEYLWLANSGLSGINKLIEESSYGEKLFDLGKTPSLISGVIKGAVFAPLEYAVGYGIGRLGSWLIS